MFCCMVVDLVLVIVLSKVLMLVLRWLSVIVVIVEIWGRKRVFLRWGSCLWLLLSVSVVVDCVLRLVLRLGWVSYWCVNGVRKFLFVKFWWVSLLFICCIIFLSCLCVVRLGRVMCRGNLMCMILFFEYRWWLWVKCYLRWVRLLFVSILIGGGKGLFIYMVFSVVVLKFGELEVLVILVVLMVLF